MVGTEVAQADQVDADGLVLGVQGHHDQVFPVGLAADEGAEDVVSVFGAQATVLVETGWLPSRTRATR